KAHNDMISLSANDALVIVETVLWPCGGCRGRSGIHESHWSNVRRFFDYKGFQSAYAFDDEEMRMEFVTAWKSVRCPYGWHPLDLAFYKASETPLIVRPDDAISPGYEQFLSVAGWLQES